MKFYQYTVALAVAAGITFGGLKSAHAELVFEDDLNGGAQVNAQPQQQAAAQPAQAQAQDMSKAEMMRRQRLREELKNEDLLTQKLEELRLKDEMKRTDQLTGDISGVSKSKDDSMQEQRVGSAAEAAQQQPSISGPVTAGQGNPNLYNTNGANGAAVQGGLAQSGQSVATVDVSSAEKTEDNMRVNITPRGGISSITNSIYNIESKFSAGANVSVDVTDYIAFSGSYTFSKYGLTAGNSLYYPTGFNMGYLQQLNLNDNVIDIGVKAYLLKVGSRVRPFIGAGASYRTGYVNFDDNTQAYLKRLNPIAAQDINITGFSGYLETGMDFKITKNIALTGSFRYFNTFSSKQSNPLDPNAFLNPTGYSGGYAGGYSPYYGAMSTNGAYGYNTDVRSQAGDALAKNNFYQLMAGVTVSF